MNLTICDLSIIMPIFQIRKLSLRDKVNYQGLLAMQQWARLQRQGSWPPGSPMPCARPPRLGERQRVHVLKDKVLSSKNRSQVSGTAAPQRLPTPGGQGHRGGGARIEGGPLKTARACFKAQPSPMAPQAFGADLQAQGGCLDQE